MPAGPDREAMRSLALATLLLAAAALPAATAHGASAPREVDARILQDDDGLTGYTPGTCAADVPGCPVSGGAPDLLSLDAREARDELGRPVVWFRVVYQTDQPALLRAVHLTFTAKGAEKEFDWSSADGVHFTTGTFARILGPTPVGDGHPQALDGMVPDALLGLAVGDQLTGFSAESHGTGEESDIMPGGWTYAGQATIPSIPNPTATAPSFPGAYTLQGPAQLLKVGEVGSLELTPGKGQAAVQVENLLAGGAQFATLTLQAPAGATASLDPAALALDGGQLKISTLKLAKATVSGNLTVTVRTDLGAYQVLSVPFKGAPATPNATAPNLVGAEGVSSTSARTASVTATSKAAPLPLPFVALALALLAARRTIA
jgi:hypothetical protein